jgi:hypothetical protein
MSVRLILLAVFVVVAPGSGAELRTLQGETISGEIVSITPKEVVILRGGQRVATPIAQILQIDCDTSSRLPTNSFTDVELTDGSLLHCEKYTIQGQEIALKLFAGPEVKIALSAVNNLLTDAQIDRDRKEWSSRLADRKVKKKRRDVLAIRKEGVLNALEGTLGDGDFTAESIEFTSSTGKKRAVALSNVAGLIFEREVDPNAAPVICKVTDTMGDVFQAAAVASSTAGLTVTTSSKARFEIALPVVVRLDFSGGKMTWLSDLEPTQVIESFVDNNPFHYKRDHNLEDGPIRIDNVTYSRGLALHATTELEYDLKGAFREFKVVAGIDDLIGGLPGTTVLRIEGDGKLLKELTFDRRDKIRQQEIVLNIKDVQKLRLRVSPGNEGLRLDLGLHLDLANAKVSK